METVVKWTTSDISLGILTHVIDGFIPLFSDASWSINTFTSAEQLQMLIQAHQLFLPGLIQDQMMVHLPDF